MNVGKKTHSPVVGGPKHRSHVRMAPDDLRESVKKPIWATESSVEMDDGNGTAKQGGVLGGCLRGQLPKKDAESGETSTGSCKRAMSRRIPNGATRERGIVRIAG